MNDAGTYRWIDVLPQGVCIREGWVGIDLDKPAGDTRVQLSKYLQTFSRSL